MHRWLLLLMLITLSACTSGSDSPDPTPPVQSSTSDGPSLGLAEQTHAPALLAHSNGVLAAWIAADDDDIYHRLRYVESDTPTDLPVLTLFPQAQTLLPGRDGMIHLLWLDADPDRPEDGLRLWSAYLASRLEVDRGAFVLSDRPTYHYAAVPLADGGIRIFYSAGSIAEPTLATRVIDGSGRPLETQSIAADVDRITAMVTDAGTMRVIWQTRTTGQIRGGVFAEGALTLDDRLSGPAPSLTLSDAITGFYADEDTIYWSVRDAEGTTTTWAAPLGGEPSPLAMRWAVPDRSGVIAAVAGDEIGVLHGETFTPLASAPGLIGPPRAVQHEGRIYLAWAEPDATGPATLRLLTADEDDAIGSD